MQQTEILAEPVTLNLAVKGLNEAVERKVTQTPLTTALFGTQQFAMRLTPSPNQEV
jgi:hypothetical protein